MGMQEVPGFPSQLQEQVRAFDFLTQKVYDWNFPPDKELYITSIKCLTILLL